LRLGSVVSACAASVLAMVFSVQQGEHGPLVVYKLQVPRSAGSVSPTAPPPALPGDAVKRETVPRVGHAVPQTVTPEPAAPTQAKAPRLSPLEPTILGTVVIPASRRAAFPPTAAPAAPIPLVPPQPASTPVALDPVPADSITADPVAFSVLFRGIPLRTPEDGVLVNEDTGDRLTLKEVNDALTWRRETADRLRQLPVGPRF
jgi:hypothetical protein